MLIGGGTKGGGAAEVDGAGMVFAGVADFGRVRAKVRD